ncbi:MAG: NifU family protein [Candidatus Sericytochromatia bacterium]|nr:NifU family protein [Candidatus Sericytochromatia bacterium]
MKVTHIERTPNPMALMFRVDEPLIARGAEVYASTNDALRDSMATAIFATGEVTELYVTPDFATVTKKPEADWLPLRRRVREVLEATEPAARAAAGQMPEAPRLRPGSRIPADGPEAEMLSRILVVLEQTILPALAGDGGGLEVLGFEDKVLTIRYQGACGTCPSSAAGTLEAIRRMLRQGVDPDLEVVPA